MQLFGEAAARLCNAAGLLLGWRPQDFWSATPAELLLALQAPPIALDVPDRAAIQALRERFPDRG